MGVNKGQMLDAILSPSTATKCVAAGWIYTTMVALLMVFLIPGEIDECPAQTNTCPPITSDYYIKTRTIVALVNLGIILGVAIIQFLSFYKLHKRLNNSVGCVTNQGLNKLFKRAMTKSVMIAIAFSLGWAPLFITIMLYDWSNLNSMMLEKVLPFLFVLGFLQGFANTIILRFKHLKEFIQKKISRC